MEAGRRRESEKAHGLSHEPRSGITAASNDAEPVATLPRFFPGPQEGATAMQITSLKDMYIAELQELASMEKQLGRALPPMSRIASHPSLKDALLHHHEQTRTQMERLESMLRNHGSSTYVHTD
jgi:hypothetical protein